MPETHHHTWTTRYTTIDQVDCASGAACACGVVLDQLDVEDRLNILERMATTLSEYFAHKPVGDDDAHPR